VKFYQGNPPKVKKALDKSITLGKYDYGGDADMKLKDYLEKNHVTQAELARKIGCSLGMVSSLVNGKRTPSIHMARRIEEATEYEVLVWDFMSTQSSDDERKETEAAA
jgi:transcriptional regulator with XRE-family HTH domain